MAPELSRGPMIKSSPCRKISLITATILVMLMLMPTITIFIDPLSVMVGAHVVTEFVRHDQSPAAQASSLGYCAGCLSFRLDEEVS